MQKTIVLLTMLILSAAQAFALCDKPIWEITPGWSQIAPVEHKSSFSPALGANTSYGIYLPPAYSLDTTTRYPVLYWLHGGMGNLLSGEDFVTLLDDAIARGVTPLFIAVLVNGPDTVWTDSKPGATPY